MKAPRSTEDTATLNTTMAMLSGGLSTPRAPETFQRFFQRANLRRQGKLNAPQDAMDRLGVNFMDDEDADRIGILCMDELELLRATGMMC